jgi:hypothetical protein
LPPDTTRLVGNTVRAALAGQAADVIGLSLLADGADQIVASALLDLGGRIEAIIPAARYREGLPVGAWPEYDRLLARAVKVHRLDFTDSTSEAHMAASELMLRQADELWAVWDGKPARGYGGTADVVACARDSGIPVQVIWPAGARRD